MKVMLCLFTSTLVIVVEYLSYEGERVSGGRYYATKPFCAFIRGTFGLLDSLISVSFRCLVDKNILSSLLLRVMCEIKNSLLMRTVVYCNVKV